MNDAPFFGWNIDTKTGNELLTCIHTYIHTYDIYDVFTVETII